MLTHNIQILSHASYLILDEVHHTGLANVKRAKQHQMLYLEIFVNILFSSSLVSLSHSSVGLPLFLLMSLTFP